VYCLSSRPSCSFEPLPCRCLCCPCCLATPSAAPTGLLRRYGFLGRLSWLCPRLQWRCHRHSSPGDEHEDGDQLCRKAVRGLQAVFYRSQTITGPRTGVAFFYCVSCLGSSGGSVVFVVFLSVSRCLALGLPCTLGAAQGVGPTSSNQKMYLSTPLQSDEHGKGGSKRAGTRCDPVATSCCPASKNIPRRLRITSTTL